MADLTLVNVSNADAQAYTLACDKPTNTASGDIMFAIVQSLLYQIDTVPSGWTSLGDSKYIYFYYKVAGASEPSSYTWAQNQNNASMSISIASYRGGFDTVDPIDSYSSGFPYITPDTTLRASSILVSQAGENIVFLGSVYETVGTDNFTTPSSLDNDWIEDLDTGNPTQDWYRNICHCNWSGSGNTGDVDITLSRIDTLKHAIIIALNPAAASGPANLKTANGLAKASVKTRNGLAIASIKTWDGLA